jgi:hypothetical protein
MKSTKQLSEQTIKELEKEGLRIADMNEEGWFYQSENNGILWVTDEPEATKETR